MHIDAKCHSIHDSFKSDPDDRDKQLIEVFSSLSVVDRAYVPAQYNILFGFALNGQIKEAISGSFGNLILLLSTTIEEAEVQMISSACDAKWSYRNEHLAHIICGRNNDEIIKLKETYKKVTEGEDLEAALKKDLQRGSYRTYVKLCLTDNSMDVYDPNKKHTKENAKKVAKELYDCGEKQFGTDVDAFFGILIRSPPKFLRMIDSAYEKKYKHSITKAIKDELTFSTEIAVLYGVGMSLNPFHSVAKAMEKTFKGIGMDPIGFNALMVRYQPYLKQIAQAYEDKTNETLLERIHYEAKGAHHDLLVRILENAINDNVDEQVEVEAEELT